MHSNFGGKSLYTSLGTPIHGNVTVVHGLFVVGQHVAYCVKLSMVKIRRVIRIKFNP